MLQFFQLPANREVIAQLRAAGVHWPQPATVTAEELPLAGQSWVVTGKLDSMTREEAEACLQQLGARAAGSVSARTSVLVAGPGAGSKLARAQELGIEIIDEAEFLRRTGRA